MPGGCRVNAFATRERELYSNWEMRIPCLALVAVSVLGCVLGYGLHRLFER